MKDKITTLQMKEGKPFRILQLTDIHLGGYIFTNKEPLHHKCQNTTLLH